MMMRKIYKNDVNNDEDHKDVDKDGNDDDVIHHHYHKEDDDCKRLWTFRRKGRYIKYQFIISRSIQNYYQHPLHTYG